MREEAPASELLNAANNQLLWQGDERTVEQAAAWLRRGLEIASDKQPFLADLGAVHLILAKHNGKTEELLRSIEYSQQALEGRPDAEGPRFNLALALSQLGLADSAGAEWQRFLESKPSTPWKKEAQTWLELLKPLTAKALLKGKKEGEEELSAMVDNSPGALRKAGRKNRQLTREWIETGLLLNWARARLAGNEEAAARAIKGAGLLASDLATVTRDRLLADSIAAISAATLPQQKRLALGHRAFAEAMSETKLSDEKLGEAERLLGPGPERGWKGSPFVLWARFNRARALNIDQQFFRAEAELAALARQVDAARYPALAGRISWIRGLATSNLGRIEESNAHYRKAAAIFCRLGETQNLVAAQGVLAAGEHKLGHTEAAWTLTRNALAHRESIFNLGRLQAILQDAANNADRQGLLYAGLYLTEEFVSVVEREGDAMNRYNALLRRNALREALGQTSGARADRAEADRILQSLSSPAQRERAEADGALERARVWSAAMTSDITTRVRPASMTGEVMTHLTRAIEYYRKTDNQQKLPGAYGLRARCYLAQQQVDLAEVDLNQEARLLESALFATSPGPLRQDLILVQDFFDQMIAFQTTVRHDDAAAFRFSERQKHWALWEWVRTEASGTGSLPILGDPLATASWSDLRATRSGDTAILSYHVLPKQVLIWVSGPRESKMVAVPETLHSKLTALLAAARRRDTRALRSSAEELHKILIAPIAASIRGASMVTIVPDRTLQELPFGLLRDPSTARYLYENHAIAYSPSATVTTRLSRVARGSSATKPRLLAFAATRGKNPRFLRLPLAAEEVEAVVAQWPSGQVLPFSKEAPLRQQLALVDGFHFAGHAVADPDSLGLVLHDDQDQPLQLTAADILGDGFPHLRLVSLSGCRTADVGLAGRIGSPSVGFVRSFLAAGVPTVVASFLDLDDRHARKVFPAFYRRLAEGEDPARAMRRACLEQSIGNRDERALLCGSLAVYGISSPVVGKISAKVRLPRHN